MGWFGRRTAEELDAELAAIDRKYEQIRLDRQAIIAITADNEYKRLVSQSSEEIDPFTETLFRQQALLKATGEVAMRIQASRELSDRIENTRRHEELVSVIKAGNIAGKAMDFVSNHPFLAGFIGADIVHRVTSK